MRLIPGLFVAAGICMAGCGPAAPDVGKAASSPITSAARETTTAPAADSAAAPDTGLPAAAEPNQLPAKAAISPRRQKGLFAPGPHDIRGDRLLVTDVEPAASDNGMSP